MPLKEQVYLDLPLEAKGSIRLVEIQHGPDTDEVEVSMTCASLDDSDLHYCCLSYAWGDASDQRNLICNGTVFPVTRNLWAALRRLQRRGWGRVWVDALCINQSDDVERAEQVKQMKRIYTQAKVVYADLGPAPERVDYLFAGMRTLGEFLFGFEDSMNDTTVLNSFNLVELGLPAYDDDFWLMWTELIARPYFQRTWVVQEIAVAKTVLVMFGDKYFDWHVLYNYTLCMRNHGIGEDGRRRHPKLTLKTKLDAIHGHNGLNLLTVFHDALRNGKEVKLQLALQLVRGMLASDLKDKVFGVLGIATDIDFSHPDFEVRYDSRESVADLFTRIARGTIREDKSNALDCLFEGGTQLDKRLPGLPSWVPDWTSRRAGKNLGSLRGPQYHAADSLDLVAAVEGSALRVRAHIIDRIARQTSAHIPDGDNEHTEEYYSILVGNWMHEACELALAEWPNILGSEGGEPKEDLWRTFICNKTHGSLPAPASYSTLFEAQLARQSYYIPAIIEQQAVEHYVPVPSLECVEADQASLAYRVAMQDTMYTKRFGITKDKRMMCRPPADAQVGDCIVLIAGSPMPFVMRRVGEDNEKWILIQECYVHGLMHGEYAQNADDTSIWQDMLII